MEDWRFKSIFVEICVQTKLERRITPKALKKLSKSFLIIKKLLPSIQRKQINRIISEQVSQMPTHHRTSIARVTLLATFTAFSWWSRCAYTVKRERRFPKINHRGKTFSFIIYSEVYRKIKWDLFSRTKSFRISQLASLRCERRIPVDDRVMEIVCKFSEQINKETSAAKVITSSNWKDSESQKVEVTPWGKFDSRSQTRNCSSGRGKLYADSRISDWVGVFHSEAATRSLNQLNKFHKFPNSIYTKRSQLKRRKMNDINELIYKRIILSVGSVHDQ